MRIQNDWCRMTKRSPRPRAWPGKYSIGSLSAAGCSANSGCDFVPILATSGICAPPWITNIIYQYNNYYCDIEDVVETQLSKLWLSGRPANCQHQPEAVSQWCACLTLFQWWPLAPGRRPVHPELESCPVLRRWDVLIVVFINAYSSHRWNKARDTQRNTTKKRFALCIALGLLP